jgi:CBS domain-containing protein
MKEASRIDPSAFEDPLSDYEPVEYLTELERSFAEETVAEIQSTPFFAILSSASIGEAIKSLYSSRVSCLLVVEAGCLVGIFTERDVLERVAEWYPRMVNRPVADVMTTNPTVVYETDPAAAALAAIAVAGHRHVPVLSIDERVLGVISPRRVCEFIDKRSSVGS